VRASATVLHNALVEVGEPASFPAQSAFSFEIDPEFPGSGDWGMPVFRFSQQGRIEEDQESVWGTPFVVRVEPRGAPAWVGMFGSGGGGGLRGAYQCPTPTDLAVIVDGLPYVVDVRQAELSVRTAPVHVVQVVVVPEPPLLLLVGFTNMVALGSDGIAWSSRRLCVDDLRVIGISPSGIVCSCDNLGGSATITVDPTTGEQTEGTTMGDLGWPGE
jgi:hypothetical protein